MTEVSRLRSDELPPSPTTVAIHLRSGELWWTRAMVLKRLRRDKTAPKEVGSQRSEPQNLRGQILDYCRLRNADLLISQVLNRLLFTAYRLLMLTISTIQTD
jgi:hypothetical protein